MENSDFFSLPFEISFFRIVIEIALWLFAKNIVDSNKYSDIGCSGSTSANNWVVKWKSREDCDSFRLNILE